MDAAPAIERVRIERRGGLAGLHPCAECTYAALSAGQQRALQRLLAANARPRSSPGADRFSYRLQVVHASGADRTLEVPEDAMPQALAALVRPSLA